MIPNMLEHDHGDFKFFTAADMLSLHEDSTPGWGELHKSHLEHMFTKRRLFAELLKVWGQTFGLEKSFILEAHGDFKDGTWNYYEGRQKVGTVQSWVDANDGQAIALMVTSCNPPPYNKLYSKSSLVMHAGRLANSLPEMVHQQGLVRLFIPGKGYSERNYKGLRRLISQLKIPT